ncbi:hypothetical protein G3I17_28390 [Streptomyces sp. SID13031]|nr:hypothetical protein [Streptomyces sp. SID13031]
MIKKWLTVVVAALVFTAITLLPGKTAAEAAPPPAEPGCGITAVCWGM